MKRAIQREYCLNSWVISDRVGASTAKTTTTAKSSHIFSTMVHLNRLKVQRRCTKMQQLHIFEAGIQKSMCTTLWIRSALPSQHWAHARGSCVHLQVKQSRIQDWTHENNFLHQCQEVTVCLFHSRHVPAALPSFVTRTAHVLGAITQMGCQRSVVHWITLRVKPHRVKRRGWWFCHWDAFLLVFFGLRIEALWGYGMSGCKSIKGRF